MEQPRVLVAITSYNRQQSLFNLVSHIMDESCNVDFVVFDDCSDFEGVNTHIFKFIKSPEHRGKAGYWKTWQDIFNYCKSVQDKYSHFIFLPDDVEPCQNFIEKAVAAFDSIPNCTSLSPLRTNYSIYQGKSRWGGRTVEQQGDFIQSHFFDGCAVVNHRFFEALNWYMMPIVASDDPYKSSGVGMQITKRLQEKGDRMFHVSRTMLTLVNDPTESIMNELERKRHPMVANWEDNYECVDVHMASLYRDGHLLKTLQTLCGQPEVATVYVTLNNYTQPQYNETMAGIKDLQKQFGCKIVTRRAKNQKGSNEKLSQLAKSTAPYIAFADDDILYPADYFLRLIHGIRLHNAAVSFHGGVLKELPTDKYYNGGRKMYSWNISVPEDVKVDIMGTGVGLLRREWFTDAELKALYNDAPEVSMDDLIVSCALSEKGISRWVLAHPSCFAHHKAQAPDDNYVYDQYKDNDAVQVAYINEHLKRY